MVQKEYTTVAIVKARVGESHVSSDIQDSEITQWIKEASTFIDVSTKKAGIGFEETDAVYPLIQQIVTDLSVIKLLLRMNATGKETTAGLSYRIGDFSVDKKNIESSSVKEIIIYEKSAKDGLETLKEYIGINNGGFVGGSIIQGAPAPNTNYGNNEPQQR